MRYRKSVKGRKQQKRKKRNLKKKNTKCKLRKSLASKIKQRNKQIKKKECAQVQKKNDAVCIKTSSTLTNATTLCVCKKCCEKEKGKLDATQDDASNTSHRQTEGEKKEDTSARNRLKETNSATSSQWENAKKNQLPRASAKAPSVKSNAPPSKDTRVRRNGRRSKSLLKYVLKKQEVKELALKDKCSCCQQCITKLIKFIKLEVARQASLWGQKKATRQSQRSKNRRKTNSSTRVPVVSARARTKRKKYKTKTKRKTTRRKTQQHYRCGIKNKENMKKNISLFTMRTVQSDSQLFESGRRSANAKKKPKTEYKALRTETQETDKRDNSVGQPLVPRASARNIIHEPVHKKLEPKVTAKVKYQEKQTLTQKVTLNDAEAKISKPNNSNGQKVVTGLQKPFIVRRRAGLKAFNMTDKKTHHRNFTLSPSIRAGVPGGMKRARCITKKKTLLDHRKELQYRKSRDMKNKERTEKQFKPTEQKRADKSEGQAPTASARTPSVFKITLNQPVINKKKKNRIQRHKTKAAQPKHNVTVDPKNCMKVKTAEATRENKWTLLTDSVIQRIKQAIQKRLVENDVKKKETRLGEHLVPMPRAGRKRNNLERRLFHSSSSKVCVDFSDEDSGENIDALMNCDSLETVESQLDQEDATNLPKAPCPSARLPSFIAMIKTAIRDLKPFGICGKRGISQ